MVLQAERDAKKIDKNKFFIEQKLDDLKGSIASFDIYFLSKWFEIFSKTGATLSGFP